MSTVPTIKWYHCVLLVGYHIVGNSWGRKLSRIGEKYDFHGENFHRLLAFTVPKDATPPNFTEKTFANIHKTEIRESFLPRKFPTIRYILTHNVFGPSVATLSCARKGRENLCLFVYFVTSFWSSCTKWMSASAVQTNNWAKFIILLVWWASARTWRDHYHHVSSLFCSETVSQVQTEKEALSRHTSASSWKEKECGSAEREEIGACIGLHG